MSESLRKTYKYKLTPTPDQERPLEAVLWRMSPTLQHGVGTTHLPLPPTGCLSHALWAGSRIERIAGWDARICHHP